MKHVVLGITGGICGGKSSAAAFLARSWRQQASPFQITISSSHIGKNVQITKRSEAAKIDLIDADKLAHEAYQPRMPAHRKIVEVFGNGILTEAGNNENTVPEDWPIDRRKLGEIVFANAADLRRLEAIVWPVIRELAADRISSLFRESNSEEQSEPQRRNYPEHGALLHVIVLEAAVMVEAGWTTQCDEVWAMEAPRNIAVERLEERNGLSREEAEKRLDAQLSNEERGRHVQLRIDTNRPREETQSLLTKHFDDFVRRHLSASEPKL